jgi:hypothetical protein
MLLRNSRGLEPVKNSNSSIIGILSMQKVVNYGSFLQAFALLQTVKKIRPNAEILFIDIKPGIHLYKNKKPVKELSRFLKKLTLKHIRSFVFFKKLKFIFNKYQHHYLGITDRTNWDVHFDSIIIGSDEVFNCLQNAHWGFAKNLLGEGLNSGNIITYAASCGHTTVSLAEAMNLSLEIEKALQNISAFSVRDKNTFDFVKRYSGKTALIHTDPVLLVDYDDYINMNNIPEYPYILIYAYQNRINSKEEISAIIDFAKRNSMEIINICGRQAWCKNNPCLTPFEVPAYFKRACYVVTDTFHGTVLSIKHNKNFVAFVRDNDPGSPNGNKLRYLLSRFNLQDREISDVSSLSEKLKKNRTLNV